MPLENAAPGTPGFSRNIETEIRAGKPQKQAVAIAYSKSGERKDETILGRKDAASLPAGLTVSRLDAALALGDQLHAKADAAETGRWDGENSVAAREARARDHQDWMRGRYEHYMREAAAAKAAGDKKREKELLQTAKGFKLTGKQSIWDAERDLPGPGTHEGGMSVGDGDAGPDPNKIGKLLAGLGVRKSEFERRAQNQAEQYYSRKMTFEELARASAAYEAEAIAIRARNSRN